MHIFSIILVLFSCCLTASDGNIANNATAIALSEVPVSSLDEVRTNHGHIMAPPQAEVLAGDGQVARLPMRDILSAMQYLEWREEVQRLEREAEVDLRYFIALGLVGAGTLLTGLTYPSGSKAYWWLTIPGFFISAFGAIAGGSFLFRKCQICCLRLGPRRL